MMGHEIAGLLVVAAVGYWVLERASTQKGQLRQVGLLVGSLILIGSLLGTVCAVVCMGGACPMTGRKMRGMGMYHKGGVMPMPEGAGSFKHP